MVGRAPVGRMAAIAAIAVLSAMPAAAEASVGVKLRVLESLTRVAEGEWTLFSLGTARVSLAAASESVKADLSVQALLGDGVVQDIVPTLARASVSVRFPRFRLTVGKARLSWGEGTAFNAADLLFGGTSALGLDLTADTLRDDAAWLVAANVSLGRFSFLEAVALPPPLDVAGLIADPLAPLPDPRDAAAGARVVGRFGGIKTEASYLYRGATRTHALAVSLQGNLLVDFHLDAAVGVPADAPTATDIADALRLTLGLFHLQRLGLRASLSMRLEALVAPALEWRETEPPPAPVTYGLVLYPELVLSIDQTLSVSARALVSPVDGSACVVPGVTVSLHKGLSFLAMASIGAGDETDTWSWSRSGGVAFMLGCAYSY